MSISIDRVISQVSTVILGKEKQIRMALACILARGHLLIEDIPGVGKTTLAHVIACSLGLEFQRIQFTSDLLPADILGVSVFERANSSFKFHPGSLPELGNTKLCVTKGDSLMKCFAMGLL